MLTGFLVCEGGAKPPQRVRVGDVCVVGRAPGCDLVLDDAAASREHVEVSADPQGFVWRDLGSTNGTLLNGAKTPGGRLQHGDVLLIGATSLRFEAIELNSGEALSDGTTYFKQTIVNWRSSTPDLTPKAGAAELLKTLYNVVHEISSNYDPCSLVDNVLEMTVRAVDAERGAILFSDEDAEGLLPCPGCGRYHLLEGGSVNHVDRSGVGLSRTVMRRVLREEESLLYQDLQDSDLCLVESVMSLDLRSILCVPVRGKNGVLGLLYLDSSRPGQTFAHDHMLLATAVGNSAGLAIENAAMHRALVEKERTDQELRDAWTIQQGFLVKDWPEPAGGIEVYGEMRPAKTVGGDFYDYLTPRPGWVGLLIGDVSGKGVPAALTMAQLLAEFRLLAREHTSPSMVLAHLNRALTARSMYGMFATLCYLLFDTATGRVCYANAGHHPAMVIGERGLRSFGLASGPPAGVLDEVHWRDEEDVIQPGETLLLYTDGVVEARPTGPLVATVAAEFGEASIQRTARERHADGPRAMIAALSEEVERYCAPSAPHDDRTLIALRRTP